MTDSSFLPRLAFFLGILCYVTGIALTAVLSVPSDTIFIASGIYLFLCLLLAAFFKRKFLYCLVGLFLPVGFLYAQWMTPVPSFQDVSRYAGQGTISLTGTIADEPLYQENKVKFLLKVESAGKEAPEQVQGQILVTWKNPSSISLRYGQKLSLEGKVSLPKGSRNPGDFSYKAYLDRQGTFSLLTVNSPQDLRVLAEGGNPILSLAYKVKHRILEGHSQALSHPFDSLLGSIVLGAKASPIPKDLQQSFRNVGLGHLLAVSGFQIAIVLGACLALGTLFHLPKLWIIGYTVPLLIFYVLMTGAPPSVVRAMAMALVGLVGYYLGREKDILAIAAFSGGVLLLIHPLWFFDIGFQFSYLATFGLIYLATPIASRLNFLPRVVGSLFGVVLASQIVILPLQFYYFNQFSWVAIPANLLAGLLIFLITIIGFVSSLLALISPFLALLPDLLLLGLMLILVQMVELFKVLPGALSFVPTPPLILLMAYYGALLLLLEGGRNGFFAVHKEKWAIFGLIFMAIYLWLPQLPGERVLAVTFLDVGQGDAALIETPGGKTLLVDGGTRSEYKGTLNDMGERVILPYLYRKGIDHLDLVVATHSDLDHLGGLISVVEKFPVFQVLDSGQTDPDQVYQDFFITVGKRNIPLLLAEEGMRLQVEPDIDLEILNPRYTPYSGTRSDSNANAILFRLIYHNQSIFFAADMEEVNEQALLASGIDFRSSILKVAHHGSKFSSSMPFLERVHPEVAIVSVGKNLFGHPHQDTLARLTEAGAAVYRTDELGAVIVKLKEDQFQVQVSD